MRSEFVFVAVEFAKIFWVVSEENFVEEIVFAIRVKQDCVVDGGEFAFRHFRRSSFPYDFVAEVLRAKDSVHHYFNVVRGSWIAVKENTAGGF